MAGPALIQLGQAVIDAFLRDYYGRLYAVADEARNGRIARRRTEEQLAAIAVPGVLAAFLLSGGSPATPAAQREIDEAQTTHRRSAGLLAQDLADGRYDWEEYAQGVGGGGIATADAQAVVDGRLQRRLNLWAFSAAGMWHAGQVYGPDDVLYQWFYGATQEHCRDCAYGVAIGPQPVSIWRQLRIRPQAHDLECGGWQCDCRRLRVDDPMITMDGQLIAQEA